MAIELTKSQRESVEYDAGDLLIKGVPGSGKSVVLMERALRFNKRAIKAGEKEKILIITFTNSLVKYTQELVDMTGLSPLMIEIKTVDKLCLDIYRGMTKKRSVYFLNAAEREELVKEAIQRHLDRTKRKHRFHAVEADFWAEEFLWIKQKCITTEEQYIRAERAGRGGKVRVTRGDRTVAYAIFQEYCALLRQAHKNDWEDIYTYLIKNADQIPDEDKYDHILVDEAQDLSYAKLKAAKLLTRQTITIAADKAQKIYSTSFSWKELGIDIHGRAARSLEKTFRSTKQIVQLAESLLEVNRARPGEKNEYTDPVLPEREGEIPQIVSCRTAADERYYVIELIRRYIEEDNVVGLLYRSYPACKVLIGWLKGAGIAFEMVGRDPEWSLSKPGVKLSTLHSSKGLEFDVIIIPRSTEKELPPSSILEGADPEQLDELKAQERSLLYVGMTRARYELYLTFSGSPSCYLYDLDPRFYQYLSGDGRALPKPKRAFRPKEEGVAAPAALDRDPADGSVKLVRNGMEVYAHKDGEERERRYIIDTEKYPPQAAFLGHRAGDAVVMLRDTYVIDKIL